MKFEKSLDVKAVSGNTMHISWNSCNNSQYYSKSIDQGATFGTIQEIPEINDNRGSIAFSGSNLVMAYPVSGEIHVLLSSDSASKP